MEISNRKKEENKGTYQEFSGVGKQEFHGSHENDKVWPHKVRTPVHQPLNEEVHTLEETLRAESPKARSGDYEATQTESDEPKKACYNSRAQSKENPSKTSTCEENRLCRNIHVFKGRDVLDHAPEDHVDCGNHEGDIEHAGDARGFKRNSAWNRSKRSVGRKKGTVHSRNGDDQTRVDNRSTSNLCSHERVGQLLDDLSKSPKHRLIVQATQNVGTTNDMMQDYPWWSAQCVKKWLRTQIISDLDYTWIIDDYCGEYSYEQEGIDQIPRDEAGTNMDTKLFREMRRKINIMEDELVEVNRWESDKVIKREECERIIRTILSICDDHSMEDGVGIRSVCSQGGNKNSGDQQEPMTESSNFNLKTAIHNHDDRLHVANGRVEEAHAVYGARREERERDDGRGTCWSDGCWSHEGQGFNIKVPTKKWTTRKQKIKQWRH